jgi:hypothetical protein
MSSRRIPRTREGNSPRFGRLQLYIHRRLQLNVGLLVDDCSDLSHYAQMNKFGKVACFSS